MNLRGLMLACLGTAALAAPASAQIIATSIPREDMGGGTGAGETRFALHLMASPFAKWNINSWVEDPKGAEFPDFQQAATTDSASKFIGAAEAAFAVSDDITIGVGGWYNTLGEPDVEVFELDLINAVVFGGVATTKLRVSEIHGNVFYRNIGVQAGLVHTSSTLTGFRAGSVVVDLESGTASEFQEDVTIDDQETQTTNNWDAFLVYKTSGGLDTRWGLSLGAGIYRDVDAESSKFSGFATASVEIFRGLGIDASYWYVGGSSPTAARREFDNLLENTNIADDMSRFTIGIGYTFR